MNKQTRNKAYPQEFREQVVKLVQAGGQTVSEIAREFEISTDSVRRWLSCGVTTGGCAWSGRSCQKQPPGSLGRPIRFHPDLRIRKSEPGGG